MTDPSSSEPPSTDSDDDLQTSLQDLSQLVMSPRGLSDTLRHIADFAVNAIPGAQGAGLTLFQEDRPDTVVATAQFVRDADSLQYLIGEGPCISATSEGRTVRSDGLGGDARFPRFGPEVAKMGVRSMLSLPLQTEDDTVFGSINVYSHHPDAFDDRAEQLGELFTVPAAISVQNAQALSQAQRLAQHLQSSLLARAERDHATGSLLARTASDRDHATAATAAAHHKTGVAVAAKNDMISRMSHELRTPLNEVLGFAQLLGLETLTTDQHTMVDHILNGGHHLLTMIDDVLDLNSARADQLPQTLESIRVDYVIADVLAQIHPATTTANITFSTTSTPPDAGHLVYADRRRLHQVLFNLLSNAVKYTHNGGQVHIRIAAPDPARIQIDVADNGPGIPTADLHRVFVPFDRLNQTTDNNGIGIGLAVSQRLVAQMNGTLEVSSAPGTGATFTLTLPTSAPNTRATA